MSEYKFSDLEELARKQTVLCRIFSSSRRILIVWVLGEKEMTVTEIAKSIGSSMQSTSQHLRLMKDKKILTSHRDGQTILYSVAKNGLMQNCMILEQSPLLKKARV